MLDMTLEQGQDVFLKALSGNNFSHESIRAYNADITQFIEFLGTFQMPVDSSDGTPGGDMMVIACES
jgi:hypothetical protein